VSASVGATPALPANQHDSGAAVRSEAWAASPASWSSISTSASDSGSTPSSAAYRSIHVRVPGPMFFHASKSIFCRRAARPRWPSCDPGRFLVEQFGGSGIGAATTGPVMLPSAHQQWSQSVADTPLWHRGPMATQTITISCSECVMAGTTACADCLVTFLVDRTGPDRVDGTGAGGADRPSASTGSAPTPARSWCEGVVLSGDQVRAVRTLAGAGLVGDLRFSQRRAG